jgi:hypothetical protein
MFATKFASMTVSTHDAAMPGRASQVLADNDSAQTFPHVLEAQIAGSGSAGHRGTGRSVPPIDQSLLPPQIL